MSLSTNKDIISNFFPNFKDIILLFITNRHLIIYNFLKNVDLDENRHISLFGYVPTYK